MPRHELDIVFRFRPRPGSGRSVRVCHGIAAGVNASLPIPGEGRLNLRLGTNIYEVHVIWASPIGLKYPQDGRTYFTVNVFTACQTCAQ